MIEYKHKCSICNKEFENNYFDKKQNKCILHCEKDDWIVKIPNKELEKLFSELPNTSQEYQKKIETFWDIFKQQITDEKVQNFNNIIFPTNYKIELKELKNKILKFNNCKFIDVFYFYFLNYVERAEFDICTFFKPVKFEYIVFKEDFIFQNCTIIEDVEIIFKNIDFNGAVSFIKTKVKSKFTFTQVRFNGIALFNNSEIEDLFFQNTFFRKESNFLDIKLSKVRSRETARIIKDSFEKQNNIIEENKYYALEMKEREKELEKDLKNGTNFFEWLVFKIHGISSNHSQDWLLALFWIISFTFLSVTIEKIFSSSLTLSDKGVLSLLVFSMIVTSNIYLSNSKRVYYLLFIVIYYLIYSIYTQDLLLECFSKTLNPFSLMQTDDPINGAQLLYKIIIAYLIYQFIVSIRQNTRRT